MISDLEPDFLSDDDVPPSPKKLRPPFRWRYAALLAVASLVGSVLVVPFSAALLRQTDLPPQFPLELLPVIMAVTFFTLLPKQRWAGLLAITYALYVGISVSMTIHWFSDFVAGAIIGTVIGVVVGRSFLPKPEIPQRQGI